VEDAGKKVKSDASQGILALFRNPHFLKNAGYDTTFLVLYKRVS
jgi:hypothetical protein